MNLKDISLKPNSLQTPTMESFWLNQKDILPFCPAMWQDELCVIKIEKGSCDVIIDGEKTCVHQQDIVVLPPFCLYTLGNVQDLQAKCCFINLRAFAHIKNNLIYLASSNVIKIVTTTQENYPLVNRALLQIAQDCHHEHMLMIDVQNLLHLLQSNNLITKNITNGKQIFAIKNALNLLHTQKNQIIVKQLAEQCGYSEFYMMKLCKKFTGFAIVDYAINYRLIQIAQQVCKTDKDFYILAQEQGFTNVSYFNRQFKKLFGITPKQFKAQNK